MTGNRSGQNPRVILGLDKDQERIASLALDPAYVALLQENDELRQRLAGAQDVAGLARALRREGAVRGIAHVYGKFNDVYYDQFAAALVAEDANRDSNRA